MVTFIVRRIATVVPTLIMISMLVFGAIELVPGTFIDILIAQQIADTGEAELSEGQIRLLERQYGIGKPIYVRWWKWASRFVQGDFGRSYAYGHRPVAQLITERMVLTVVLSLCSIVFSYVVALPIGIYSAVRQYTLGDNVFTVISFPGPEHPQFPARAGADRDQLLPVRPGAGRVVLGRVRRRSLEPGQGARPAGAPVGAGGGARHGGDGRHHAHPARQPAGPASPPLRGYGPRQGLRERIVVVKYPLRIALNPFITGIGFAFPAVVGGELIVSIVLNLPTTGPLLYDAVTHHDAFLAGAMVMLLSTLLVVGNLVADLTLAWVDPRIRYE